MFALEAFEGFLRCGFGGVITYFYIVEWGLEGYVDIGSPEAFHSALLELLCPFVGFYLVEQDAPTKGGNENWRRIVGLLGDGRDGARDRVGWSRRGRRHFFGDRIALRTSDDIGIGVSLSEMMRALSSSASAPVAKAPARTTNNWRSRSMRTGTPSWRSSVSHRC